MNERKLRVVRNIHTQERVVFRHHYKPYVFHNVSDYSIARIERLAQNKETTRYASPTGQQLIANWYTF